ncbi:MAG: phosphoribosyltransferase [Candidatus Hodarchaeota archaeon]
MRFRDRETAGRTVAALLAERLGHVDLSLLAIPNGGIPVGLAIRETLASCCSFGLLFVRKLQIPYNPEAGFGAVTLDGKLHLNQVLLTRLKLSEADIETSKQLALQSLRSRAAKYGVTQTDKAAISNRTVVIVDDGLASGFTMLAAVHSIEEEASRIVVAVPTASHHAVQLIESQTNGEVLCPDIRSGPFFAVADAYDYWCDIPDEEAIAAIRTLEE